MFLKQDHGKKMLHSITTGITGTATLSYLAMALGYGHVVLNGRPFYWMRYCDWVLTTPLLLIDLCALASVHAEKTTLLIISDFLMIVSGLLGGFLVSWHRYLFWGIGMVFFVPIISELPTSLYSSAQRIGTSTGKTFSTLSKITLFLWAIYPIVWLLAEGAHVLSPEAEAICYVVLDLSAKGGFGLILLNSREALQEAHVSDSGYREVSQGI
eukprot:CAMPEP_0177599786 /NCGR_PEP_ID=MMETSP0419_2-20121207/13205_1 /TAXON_ID=582737 /ORGANISM="Tetraselmis sp., Strain GSL018" /LENGTH=211 /DNA_ID=CAMNT_0019092595 /DNA_START=142 /DNA_END=777 /DNA_ORIENTATION=-